MNSDHKITVLDVERYRYLCVALSFVLAIVLNYAILPAESALDSDGQFSLLVRGYFWVAVAVLSAPFLRARGLKKNVILFSVFYMLLFLLANYGDSKVSTSWLAYFIFLISGSVLIVTASSGSVVYRAIFMRSVSILIVTWVALFLFQWFVFLVKGDVIDIHNALVPYSIQRSEELGGGLIRMGGVHIEPGTYSNWLYGLVLIRLLGTGVLFDRLAIVAMATLPLSGSFWGVLASSIYFSGYVFAGGRARIKGLAIVFLVIAIGVATLTAIGAAEDFVSYVVERSTLEDNSSQAKVDAYEGFLRNIGDYAILGQPYVYDFCGGCYSPQDAGIFLNTVVRIGLVGAVVVFGVVVSGVYFSLGFVGVLFTVPMFFAKWYYWDHVFWLFMLFSVGQIGVGSKRGIRARGRQV